MGAAIITVMTGVTIRVNDSKIAENCGAIDRSYAGTFDAVQVRKRLPVIALKFAKMRGNFIRMIATSTEVPGIVAGGGVDSRAA